MAFFYRRDSELDEAAARIRHDWLEHQVILPLREGDWEPDGPTAGESMSLERTLEWVNEVVHFADSLEFACSPARLVQEGPLSALPGESVKELASWAHSAYLDLGWVQSATEELRGLARELIEALRLLAAERLRGGPGRSDRRERMLDVALGLHDALGRAPRGIIMP